MNWVALIPLLPVAAFAVFAPASRKARGALLWLPVAAMASSAALSIVALVKIIGAGHLGEEPLWHMAWPLATLGGKTIELSMALDPIAAIVLCVVTIVATCVQIYSFGYMHGEKRIGWYYAVLSLFTAAMLFLVLSSSLLLTFMAWEMMGLCSYLLIGFWYEEEAPRKASQKAFLTTRVGDLGFLIALFAIYANTNTFDLATVLEKSAEWAPGVAIVVSVGLLWAAMGKSAQMPLHVWLPDAMAGPTPASALIHAATMVAAGVFVVARTLPIFEHAPVVLNAMLIIGAITAIAGGLMGAVQYDIKKVLAYSTISQLGLMFVALGVGTEAAMVAGLFHLATHAFFKSLLFLGAGSIIHGTHTQDMREMGGLRKDMPVTTAVFTVGTLALAGVFPFAGFFSKDEIVFILMESHNYAAVAAVLFASGFTAFYMARLWFRVFTGKANTHGHESAKSMLLPMVLLAGITTVVGFAGPFIVKLIEGEMGGWPQPEAYVPSLTVAVIGIAVGWWVFGKGGLDTEAFKKRFAFIHTPLSEKLYFDRFYDFAFIKGYFRLTDAAWSFDSRVVDGAVNGAGKAYVLATSGSDTFDRRVVDGIVNGLASIARFVGGALRKLQTGRLQSYQRLVVGALVVLMFVLVLVRMGA